MNSGDEKRLYNAQAPNADDVYAVGPFLISSWCMWEV